jgi:C-terminal processing protease CtpA/Prc
MASASAASSETPQPAPATTAAQARNLQKLCKVWGFAKYTHRAFLTGQKSWDDELLKMIPIAQNVSEEDINPVLYEWFSSLGDDGYEVSGSVYARLDWQFLPESMPVEEIQEINSFIGQLFQNTWLSLIEPHIEPNDIYFTMRVDKARWPDLQEMVEKYDVLLIYLIDEPSITTSFEGRQTADMSWVSETYLGSELYEALSRFKGITVTDLRKAPVFFDSSGNSVYSNEDDYINMDYSDSGYRLLGLFRLWNAMEYYFPYKDIMDDDWNALLGEFIPVMLEGSDRLSYESTIARLNSKLHDAHITTTKAADKGYDRLLEYLFGSYVAPITLTEAEGHIVVSNDVRIEHKSLFRDGPEVEAGDIILKVNSRNIDEVIEEMKQYISYPNDEKAAIHMEMRNELILRQASDSELMEIDILRGDIELKVYIRTIHEDYWQVPRNRSTDSHLLLDGNICLINPQNLSEGDIRNIMQNNADTDGLIIDLRQYPGYFFVYELSEYLVDERQLFAIMSNPSPSIPGLFLSNFYGYSGGTEESNNPDVYFYDKKVVLLMNAETMSQPEFTIMSLRNGPNVTVMGTNSIGADGNITYLPLPGGINMTYTGLGVYTPEGGQTQRIGLTPDIVIERTIEGIKQGRDELMEAAVQFILE